MRTFTRFAIAFTLYAPAIRAEPTPGELTFGDDRLRLVLAVQDGLLREVRFDAQGRALPGVQATAWSARIDGQPYSPVLTGLPAAAPGGARLRFTGKADTFGWELHYSLTGPGRITKLLRIVPSREIRVEDVTLWDSTEPTAPSVSRTSLQDIAAFYREGARGLFVSLDFPCSRIDSVDGHTCVSYPPHRTFKPGEVYETHSLTIGAFQPTGVERHGNDTGAVAAMDEYVQERFTPRFQRPMVVSCSIVNRYTQVRGDVVFYSMRDHPTLRDNTDLLERELALMPQLGVEHYQVFPGVFDWGPDDPSDEQVSRLMNVARRHGVRMGDYSGTSHLFCGHYNEYRNRLDRPEWLIRNAAGQSVGSYCFGCPAFVDHYIATVVPRARQFGFEIHCLDFLSMQPCHSSEHGHPSGKDSLYHAVSGLVRLLEAINAVSPQMMTWSNSGNWAELLPKIAWHNPNLYLTDPFISAPWQGLNMTRLLDDARREQMVGLHYARFTPYRFFSNCQYFFSQNSIVPDIRHYAYGALSTLAVTPNLCLGEIRPWLDRLPEPEREGVIGFYKRWTDFVREHFDLWKKTYHVGDDPGMGSVEIYAHAARDRGFIFLVNPQYWSRTVEVPLDTRLGFSGDGRCEVAELYPVERLRLTSAGPIVPLGSALRMEVPAQQVVVLEVRPAPASIDTPRLYGLPGAVTRSGDACTIRTHGLQGSTERAVLLLPPGSPQMTNATVRTDVPKIPKRLWSPTPLTLWASAAGEVGPAAVLDLTFRREPVPDELRLWTVHPGVIEQGLAAAWHAGKLTGDSLRFPLFAETNDARILMPMSDAGADEAGLGPLANFCGAFVENAFGEFQETWIDLAPQADDAALPTTRPSLSQEPQRASDHTLPPQAFDPAGQWWLQTTFSLPFMYMIGAEPAFDEHTILVLPMIRHHRVKRVSAWINGQPLDVRLYRYPRNRGLGCYYADLVGSAAVGGSNTLVVHLAY